MMKEAVITVKNYVPESFYGVNCDQFYGIKDGENKEYFISCYSLIGLYATINAIRKYGLITISGDSFEHGDNPCRCGIPTCLDGELCGVPSKLLLFD